MINEHIFPVEEKEFSEIIFVWEASVRATHHFLSEDDIQFFKSFLSNGCLNEMRLACMKNSHQHITGFIGVVNKKIEMLFIAPDYQGQGIGKKLLSYGIDGLGATAVDVNEQNIQAVGFYKHAGFAVTGRSATDGCGKPFPLLHLQLPSVG